MRIIILIILSFFTNISFADHLIKVSAEEYKKDNPSMERVKIIDYITNQFLNNNLEKISQAEIDKIWYNLNLRKSLLLSRFQIINQEVYADAEDVAHPYFKIYLEYFQYLTKKYHISDVDFIFYLRDEIPETNIFADDIKHFPAFIGSKDEASKYEKNLFILPDPFIVQPEWSNLLAKIDEAKKQYNWKNKLDLVFWRGGTTGMSKGGYNINNIDKLPRVKLIFLSKLFPELVDAKFTYFMDSAFYKKGKELKQVLTLLDEDKKNKVKEVDHLKYKYLIAVDGNTSPWVRVPWIMHSNSILIKEKTTKIQWFYSALEEYYNYVPIDENLRDLFKQIEWMKENDKLLKVISNNAQKFIADNLTPEDIEIQMVIILNQYAKIQKDKELKITLKKAEEVISLTALFKSLFNRVEEKILGWF